MKKKKDVEDDTDGMRCTLRTNDSRRTMEMSWLYDVTIWLAGKSKNPKRAPLGDRLLSPQSKESSGSTILHLCIFPLINRFFLFFRGPAHLASFASLMYTNTAEKFVFDWR